MTPCTFIVFIFVPVPSTNTMKWRFAWLRPSLCFNCEEIKSCEWNVRWYVWKLWELGYSFKCLLVSIILRAWIIFIGWNVFLHKWMLFICKESIEHTCRIQSQWLFIVFMWLQHFRGYIVWNFRSVENSNARWNQENLPKVSIEISSRQESR